MTRRISLIVTDGWGVAKPEPGNYVSFAKTPNMNLFLKKYPHTLLKASGNAVGLPEGAQGNSEVGHLHMGAGKIVWQMYERINRSLGNGSFFKNKVLLKAMKTKRLHLMGLCSDEGVHSHTDHLIALLKMAKKQKVNEVFVHFFADGRDVPEKSAKKYAKLIENAMKKLKIGKITTVVGRYYSMDRDKNWGRTKKAYDMLVLGKGFKATSAKEAIEKAYERGDKTDYYIQPTVIEGTIKDKDSVIFFNFRTDRPRQLVKAFISKRFKEFKREKWPKVKFTTMTQYNNTFDCPFSFK
jgi:2,3-bisphosphoglycerate-independent phosphoglycerate mutase